MNNIGVPNKGSGWGLWMIVGTFAASILTAQTGDFRWTLYLREHAWPPLIDFMGRTLFEGQGFGGGDLVILYIFAAVAAYYLSWKRISDRRLCYRPWSGFVVSSAVVFALGLVHALKWSMGRARPFEVLHSGLPFTPWYLFGPHFVTEGIYRGSFPSGHTAQAAVLLTLCYLSFADPLGKPWTRWAGRTIGVFALSYTAVMGIARCMALSHWLTDVVAGLFLTWLGIHLMYHRLLRVPDQVRFFDRHGRLPDAPAVWELKLSAWLLGTIAAGAAGTIGVRAIWQPDGAVLALLIPTGAILLFVSLKRARALCREAFRELDGGGP